MSNHQTVEAICHAAMQMQESGSAQGGRPKKNDSKSCFKHYLTASNFENLGTAIVHMHSCRVSDKVERVVLMKGVHENIEMTGMASTVNLHI